MKMNKKLLANVTTMILALGTMLCPNAARAEEGNQPAVTSEAVQTELPPPKRTVKPLPVAKATFHRYTNLRAGTIKIPRGWNVQDWAISLFNPTAKPIEVTWKLIADDPTYIYNKGEKGIWSKVFKLRPMTGVTYNVAGVMVKMETNWTGTALLPSGLLGPVRVVAEE